MQSKAAKRANGNDRFIKGILAESWDRKVSPGWKNYLLVIDYLSNYPEMVLLPSLSATCVISHMKSIFLRNGIPRVVYGDNGSCYR